MEQERIPFDIEYRPDIKAGKYLVETREGKSARIICWDKRGPTPIVALISKDERCDEIVDYHINGKYFFQREASCLDLFLIPNPDYKEPTTTCSTSVDWVAFRRVAAKDFASAMLSNSALVDDRG